MAVASGGEVFLVLDAFSDGATAQPIDVEGEATTMEGEIIDELRVADFNGDGLGDLAVVTSDAIRVLRSLPVNP